MRIVRVPTKQGHPVPERAYYARGPFSPELTARPEVIVDYVPQADGGGIPIPEGGTAQNNYQPLAYYRCKDCQEIISERDLDTHECVFYDDEEDYEEEDEYGEDA